jgi:hypothetical protein
VLHPVKTGFEISGWLIAYGVLKFAVASKFTKPVARKKLLSGIYWGLMSSYIKLNSQAFALNCNG